VNKVILLPDVDDDDGRILVLFLVLELVELEIGEVKAVTLLGDIKH
jgi:hypothetical protein